MFKIGLILLAFIAMVGTTTHYAFAEPSVQPLCTGGGMNMVPNTSDQGSAGGGAGGGGSASDTTTSPSGSGAGNGGSSTAESGNSNGGTFQQNFAGRKKLLP